MKQLSICLLILSVGFPLRAEGPSLREARQRWLRGNYEEARALYETLAKTEGNRAAAAAGVSKTWESQGEYDKALAVVESALKKDPKSVPLLARQAEVFYLRGRWDDAEKTADKALELHKDNFLARWVRAQVYRDRGDLKKAGAEFYWFVSTYSDRLDNNHEITDPDELLLVGLAGCEDARWNNKSGQFQTIITDVYGDALKQDKYFWPAEYHAGALFLEKYNRGDGLPAFEKALIINARAAQVYVGKGIAALQKYEIKSAEEFAERALTINPSLVEALTLRADVYLAAGSPAKAREVLEKARTVNPRDEACLGRLAACFLLQRQSDEFNQLIKEVEKHNRRPGPFYFALADSLEDRRRYEEAEKYYKKSIELWPMLPWPRNGLGMLYLALGREKEARTILNEAFEADPHNVRVMNSLMVLRHLDKYETLRTAHFELRFDPRKDRELAQYMSRYLEEIYEDLAREFQYRPKGPFLVELFNNHDMFSGRVIALPDLHTIGACSGRVVAMVSPRGKGIARPFNWARVLRHETVHLFNLEQTNFLVPHWFTEGLAVISEGFPRPQEWNRLLVERVPKNELMNLDTIDLGFIRPRSPLDRSMAYCQSQLYVEYLKETHGPEAVGALLQAYGEGLETAAAIARVCKVDKAVFEKGYRASLEKVVRGLQGGQPVVAKGGMGFRELKEAHEKNPDDLDLAARLAEVYLRRDKGQARTLADTVLSRKKTHPLASYVKARLLRAAGEEEQALHVLEAAAGAASTVEPKVLEELGKLYYESAQFAKAAAVYERARKSEPHESKWLTELARVYAQSGDKSKRIEVLKNLVPTDADELDQRKLLARLLHEAGADAEAERYARQALEIDVLDAEAELLLGDALRGQKKYPAAIETYQLAVSICQKDKSADKESAARLKLARAYQLAGDKQKALHELARVLARDEDNEEAKKLKGELEKP